LEGANQKGKRISAEAPLAHDPDGPTREATAYGEGCAGVSRVGPVRPDPGENSNGNLILNFK
jgi:hypothetical protein